MIDHLAWDGHELVTQPHLESNNCWYRYRVTPTAWGVRVKAERRRESSDEWRTIVQEDVYPQ